MTIAARMTEEGRCPTCGLQVAFGRQIDVPAPAAPGWVACAERQPEPNVRVLADCGRWGDHTAFYSPEDRCWYAGFHDEPIASDRVLRWMPMPLPAAPEAT